MKIYEAIKLVMNEKKINQKELAKKANITEASMSKYLSGDRTPRIDVLLNIANALDVSIDSLVGSNKNAWNGLQDAKLVLARGKDSLSEEDKKELIKFILENFES